MSDRIIVGIVREIFKGATAPMTVRDVNKKLIAAGMRIDPEKVRKCIVNLYGRKWIESVTTDYKNGSTYQIRTKPSTPKIVIIPDNRTEYEKMKYPQPMFKGEPRVFRMAFDG
jgi:hypothetical protein